MKKILHVITGLSDGGAEAVLYRLCTSDRSSEHVVVSLMDYGKYGPLLEDASVRVYSLNMPSGGVKLFALFKLFKLIKEFKPDVVQTWMYHADLIGGMIARMSGVKNVVWGVHHTNLVKGESSRTTILVAKLNAFLSCFVPRRIIYCASKSRQVQESVGFRKSIGEVVPNGYEIDDFSPKSSMRTSFRQEMMLSPESFLVGHVGRFDPQKDHETLLFAISSLNTTEKDFFTILVGSNLDDKNSILSRSISAKNVERNVTLLGRRNDIPTVMNGFDLFVLSSSFGEAFPNVLNEAMACGVPCVTTDVGDAALIVGDTGWVVPPKSPTALANAIVEAMNEQRNNPQAWLARKSACRKRIVENFSIERMISEYHRVWSDGA